MPVSPALLELQERDSAIASIRSRLADLQEAKAVRATGVLLADRSSKLESAAALLKEAESERNRLDGEVEMLERRIADANSRLMGGNVSNPRELTALQEDIKMLERKRAHIEDDELEVLVNVDTLKAAHDELEAECEKLASDLDVVRADRDRISAELDAELVRLEAGRAADAAEVDDDVLAVYDRLLTKRPGPAAAMLDGGMCRACNIAVPPADIYKLADEAIPRCPQCEVILVQLETEDDGTPETGASDSDVAQSEAGDV